MKTGAAQIEAVSVFCPECDEAFDWPTGSQMLATGDNVFLQGGDVVKCLPCGKKFRLPAVVDKLGQKRGGM